MDKVQVQGFGYGMTGISLPEPRSTMMMMIMMIIAICVQGLWLANLPKGIRDVLSLDEFLYIESCQKRGPVKL